MKIFCGIEKTGIKKESTNALMSRDVTATYNNIKEWGAEIRILTINFFKHSILFTDFTDKNNVPNRNINSEEDIIGK